MSVDKMTSMVELIGFYSGQLGPELLEDEVISFGSIIMIENEWVTKVDSVGREVRNRKNILDSKLALVIHTFAEHNRGFRKIWVWPEALQKD